MVYIGPSVGMALHCVQGYLMRGDENSPRQVPWQSLALHRRIGDKSFADARSLSLMS